MKAAARDLDPTQAPRDGVPTASGEIDPQWDDAPRVSALGLGKKHKGPGYPLNEASRSETLALLDAPRTDSAGTDNPAEPVPCPRVVPLRGPQFVARSHFIPLQKFEGIVLSVGSDSFIARLVDKTGSAPDEEAEIPLAEVTGDDFKLVEVGAVFYWSIGYSVDRTGSLRRGADIRFRRLPAWTGRELEKARQYADRALEELGWDS